MSFVLKLETVEKLCKFTADNTIYQISFQHISTEISHLHTNS